MQATELCGTTQLPQEIWDMVIHCHHGDPETLKSCSLVCHSWTTSASKHLFARFSWPNSRVSGDACENTGGTFGDLARLLAEHPRVSGAIQWLWLSSKWHVPEIRQVAHDKTIQKEEPLSAETLVKILKLVPRLATLVLDDCEWKATLQGRSDVRHEARLEKLVLNYHWGTIQSFDNFGVLTCFGHIGQVVVQDYSSTPVPQISLARCRARVDSLCIMMSIFGVTTLFIESLPFLVDVPAITRLELFEWRRLLPKDTQSFLGAVTRLEKLRIPLGEEGISLPTYSNLQIGRAHV